MRKGKRFLAVVMTAAMIVSSVAANGMTASAKTKKTTKKTNIVKSIQVTNVDGKTLVLKNGKTYKLKTKVKVKGKVSKKVTYTSSNPRIVSVTKSGKLTAKKDGTAKVTVKSKANAKKRVTITVKVATPVSKLTVNMKKATLKAGETVKLKATISPKKATIKKVTFTSKDKKVATVSKKGVVTGVTAGTTYIVVKAKDGHGLSKKVKITVTEDATTAATTAAPVQPETPVQPEEPTQPEEPAQPETPDDRLSYEGYTLKWSDEFEGTELNRADWNVETHEKGWVNNELQEYVDSTDNIKVKDGNLVIKPIKTGDGDTATYTSGRVNTQGKHDFTYGLFEVRAKVPAGAGYLPAFWMMPTEESLYGQWPRCGEIDAMEVMGQENNKVYGTIHFGNPHSEKQDTYTLSEGNFTDDYHVFSCEWEPGKIRWYVDGVKYHETSDWYSTTEGQGTISYPAPFDQPFYMILNLAVGGSWVGNPDANTDFDNAAFVVDYVKAYQKDSYDENVERPVVEVILRDPDANGNYINNGDFAVAEDLTDDTDWKFMTALGGQATAAIANNTMSIQTTDAGTEDYSVQLVQAGVPLEKGATYQVSFDAKATAARGMNVAVKAPDRGYMAYMSQNVDLTTEYATYTYTFKMKSDSDANGRLEFNMGAAGSTAAIDIKNVKLIKTIPADPNAVEEKTVLSNGNYVYNGAFQEGKGRLGYWDITKPENTTVTVTSLADGRRLHVVNTPGAADAVVVSQSDLALTNDMEYAFSFEAQAAAGKNAEITYVVAGNTYTANVTDQKKTFTQVIPAGSVRDKKVVFRLGKAADLYLDNVQLVENCLIKNGSFNADLAGYELYVGAPAVASCVVDSISEDNAADFTIKDTGDFDYKIQLKQNNVKLENGHFYKLTFKAKSSVDRKIRVIMQGGEALNWPVYSGENTVDVTNTYQTYTKYFEMTDATDPEAFLSICLGTIGDRITTQHRVCVDDITLDEITEAEMPAEEEPADTDNLIKNGDFAEINAAGTEATSWAPYVNEATSVATWSFADNQAKATITSLPECTVAENDKAWHVSMKQNDLKLYADCKYELTADVTSDVDRAIGFASMDKNNVKWYVSGSDEVALVAGQKKTVKFTIDMTGMATDKTAYIAFNLGPKLGRTVPQASTIIIDNVKLVKVSGTETTEPGGGEDPGTGEEPGGGEDPGTGEEPGGGEDPGTGEEPGEGSVNLIKNPSFADADANWYLYTDAGASAEASADYADGIAKFDITNLGTADWNVQLSQSGITLQKNHKYQVKFKATSSQSRKIRWAFVDPEREGFSNIWYAGGDVSLSEGVEEQVNTTFLVSGTREKDAIQYPLLTSNTMKFCISMGKVEESDVASVVTIDDVEVVDLGLNQLALDYGDWAPVIANNEDATVVASMSEIGNGVEFDITSVHENAAEWQLRLASPENIKLENGHKYCLSFDVLMTAGANRKIKYGILFDNSDAGYPSYCSYISEDIAVDTPVNMSQTFTVDQDTRDTLKFYVNLGNLDDYSTSPATSIKNTGAATIQLTNFQLFEVTE